MLTCMQGVAYMRARAKEEQVHLREQDPLRLASQRAHGCKVHNLQHTALCGTCRAADPKWYAAPCIWTWHLMAPSALDMRQHPFNCSDKLVVWIMESQASRSDVQSCCTLQAGLRAEYVSCYAA